MPTFKTKPRVSLLIRTLFILMALTSVKSIAANTVSAVDQPPLYRFYIVDGHKKYWGAVKPDGSLVIEPTLGKLWSTRNASVDEWRLIGKQTSALWQYYDQHGQRLNDQSYDEAKNFSEGLARVKQAGKWGFVNVQGQAEVPITYELVLPMLNGMAVVKGPSGYAYINRKGEVAIQGPFAQAMSFSPNGLAAAAPPGKSQYGFINRQGQWVIEPRFSATKGFGDGEANLATVQVGKDRSLLETLIEIYGGDSDRVEKRWGVQLTPKANGWSSRFMSRCTHTKASYQFTKSIVKMASSITKVNR